MFSQLAIRCPTLSSRYVLVTKYTIVIITMNNEYNYSGPDLLLDLIAIVINSSI